MNVRLLTLGEASISRDGTIMPVRSRPVKALLGYLVAQGRRPVPRDVAAATIFAHRSESEARRDLRQTLWKLRQLTSVPILESDSSTLALVPDALSVDAWDFEQMAQEVTSASGDCSHSLGQETIRLYRGEFMSGLYDDWVLSEQRRLHELFLSVMFGTARLAKREGDLAAAIATLRRLLDEAPDREAAHRELLRTLLLAGQPDRALAEHDRLASLLREQVGAEPARETVALRDYIARSRTEIDAPAAQRPYQVAGRAGERGTLRAMLDNRAGGDGSWALIEAGPGMGKSVLLRDCAESARWRGMRSAVITCTDDGRAFAVVRAVFAELCDPITARRITSRLSPSIVEMVAPIAPVLSTPAELDERHHSADPTKALASVLTMLLELEPTYLGLDDLHLVDPESAAVLQLLATEAPAPAAIAVAYRRGDVEPGSAPWAVLAAAETRSDVHPISLGPLEHKEIGQLIASQTGGEEPAPAAVEVIREHSGGNPLFVLQIVRHLRSTRTLTDAFAADCVEAIRDELVNVHDVDAIIDLHLSKLDRWCREVADVLALRSGPVPPDLLEAVVDAPAELIWDSVGELVKRGLVTAEGDAPSISHGIIAGRIRRSIAPDRLDAFHRAIVDALQSGVAPFDPAELARHAELAGDTLLAVEQYLAAGEAAARIGAKSSAADHSSHAVRLLDNGVPAWLQATVLLAFDDAAAGMGNHEERLAAIERLEALGHDERDVAFRTARIAVECGDYHDGIASVRALVDGPNPDERWVTALATWLNHVGDPTQAVAELTTAELDEPTSEWNLAMADSLVDLQRYEEALGEYLVAALAADEAEDVAAHARARSGAAAALIELGQFQRALSAYEEAIEMCERIGDPAGAARAEANLGTLHAMEGRVVQAVGHFSAAGNLYEALHDARGAAIVAANAATLRVEKLGDHDGAAGLVDRAAAAFERLGDQRGIIQIAPITARIRAASGDPDAAVGELQGLVNDRHALDNQWLRLQMLIGMGAILLDAGRPQHSIGTLREAVDTARELGITPLEIEAGAYLCLAEVATGQDATGTLDAVARVAGDSDWPVVLDYAASEVLRVGGIEGESLVHLIRAHDEIQSMLRGLDPAEQARAWANVPIHRDVSARYAKVAPRFTTARLPHRDAPTGRRLRNDDFVDVEWSVSEPSDLLIESTAARRRAVLRRLVQQAASVGAMPRLQDLADGTGFSIATIRRDLDELRRRGDEILLGRHTSD